MDGGFWTYALFVLGIVIAATLDQSWRKPKSKQPKSAPRQPLPTRATHPELLELSPADFERFVAATLTRAGYRNVIVCGQTADQGVDIRCSDREGRVVVVQCKRYSTAPVGASAIRDFFGAIGIARASYGIFVCTSGFTTQARAHAASLDIRLVDAQQLLAMQVESGRPRSASRRERSIDHVRPSGDVRRGRRCPSERTGGTPDNR